MLPVSLQFLRSPDRRNCMGSVIQPLYGYYQKWAVEISGKGKQIISVSVFKVISITVSVSFFTIISICIYCSISIENLFSISFSTSFTDINHFSISLSFSYSNITGHNNAVFRAGCRSQSGLFSASAVNVREAHEYMHAIQACTVQ